MAIKGNTYTKTTWAFQERPVASAKLNTWDDRIESALQSAFTLINWAFSGRNGVIRGAAVGDLKVQSLTTPAMSVRVQPGNAMVSGFPYALNVETETVDVTAPTTFDRIDLVQVRLNTWDIHVKSGTESATPTAPAPDEDSMALAKLYLRPGMASIKNSDDAVNGYVVDIRTFV